MTIVTVFIWLAQLFVAGIPLIWVGILAGLGCGGFFGAYFFLPHVTKRVDQFFSPAPETSQHDLYQVTKSLQAFMNGGFFGRGPGEGIVKKHIPDVHADFIFAVAGEEFGLILCLGIIFIFLFIIVRSLLRAMNESSIFVMLATTGLISQFCFQTLINMASSLHLIPTKGMTLPFISYGGSSSIALGIGMGILLSLTRKRHGFVEEI
jgi:cell division protein FtsW